MNETQECQRFLGVSLSGAKTPKTSLAVFEYYIKPKRWVLAHIFDKISTKDEKSADQILYEYILNTPLLQSIHIDAPLTLPKCMRCDLKCPGYEVCMEEEVVWMRQFYKKASKGKRPQKTLSPYVERAAELYWREALGEKLILDHAGGANKAPLMFRGKFVNRRLSHISMQEFFPRISVWQIGRAYRISKSTLRTYSHSVYGQESRNIILTTLEKKIGFFIYEVERRKMLKDLNAFDAFIGSLTGVYASKKLIMKPDKNFPSKEAWPDVPEERPLL